MRDVKFRAWDKSNKEMLNVDCINWYMESITIYPKDTPAYSMKFKHIILMQFTGLKDNNGVEMYEGDIVKFKRMDGEESIGEISYIDTCGGFFVIHSGCSDNQLCAFSDYEVIGNVYENAKLLEG